MDFTDKSSQEEILEILRPRKLDFVLSDMAPKASGFKSLDQENIVKLVYPVVVFAVQNLRIGGGCLVKIWEGKHQNLVKEMKRFFKLVTYEKPKATYDSSSEIYLLGREFLGLEK